MSQKLQPNQWVNLYADYLYSYAVFKVSDSTLAEDLVQDTFLSAFKNRDGFQGKSSEKTWLSSILNNKIIDYYRSKRHDKLEDYLEETEESFHNGFFIETKHHWKPDTAPKQWKSSPEEELIGAELSQTLEECMNKMPDKVGQVFKAKFVSDDETDNICKDYGLTSSNYWVIIHRAKLLMRACMEKNWFNK